MEGQTNGPSVFAIQVMATEGPLLVGSTLDSHGQGWPCREWACKQASRDPMSEDCLFLQRAFFFFFFLTLFNFPPRPLRRARDVVKFPTAHTYVSGREHENSFVSYWKVSRGDREFKVWSLGATYIRWEGRRYTLYIYLPETLFCRTY